MSIRFELPSTTGGQPPVVVNCVPEPGYSFSIGTTEVACNASDVLRQAAGCAFRVSVLGPPRLGVTRFLAFGDSITAGWVAPPDANSRFDPNNAYPNLLQRELQSRYVTQTIEVIGSGRPAKRARHAVPRFRRAVTRERPEVVLLMEGTNDLDVIGGGGAALATQAMDSMVQYAQSTGAEVLLMTIPPQVGTGAAALVGPYNGTLRSIAVRRSVVLVDVYDLLLHGSCPGGRTTPCIGGDGLHPTAEGNRLIAEELARVIVDRYDVASLPEGESRQSAGFLTGPGVGLLVNLFSSEAGDGSLTCGT